MKWICVLGLVISSSAIAGEYDFDYTDKNDMRGAWKMCKTTGFTQGDCPTVYEKCHQPPMIYKRHGKIKSYCPDDPMFSVGDDDRDRYLDEGSKRALELTGEGE